MRREPHWARRASWVSQPHAHQALEGGLPRFRQSRDIVQRSDKRVSKGPGRRGRQQRGLQGLRRTFKVVDREMSSRLCVSKLGEEREARKGPRTKAGPDLASLRQQFSDVRKKASAVTSTDAVVHQSGGGEGMKRAWVDGAARLCKWNVSCGRWRRPEMGGSTEKRRQTWGDLTVAVILPQHGRPKPRAPRAHALLGCVPLGIAHVGTMHDRGRHGARDTASDAPVSLGWRDDAAPAAFRCLGRSLCLPRVLPCGKKEVVAQQRPPLVRFRHARMRRE